MSHLELQKYLIWGSFIILGIRSVSSGRSGSNTRRLITVQALSFGICLVFRDIPHRADFLLFYQCKVFLGIIILKGIFMIRNTCTGEQSQKYSLPPSVLTEPW